MIIGVPKEIKQQEHRVGPFRHGRDAHPQRPHRSRAKECRYRLGLFRRRLYRRGRDNVDRAEDVFAQADLIVKVKEPLPPEFDLLRKGQIFLLICTSRRASRSRKR